MLLAMLTVLTVFSSVLRILMILLPARPPERDLQASAHAALRRARGFGKSVRSSVFILLNAIISTYASYGANRATGVPSSRTCQAFWRV